MTYSVCHNAGSWVLYLLNQNLGVGGGALIHSLTGFLQVLMHSNIWELMSQVTKLTLVYKIDHSEMGKQKRITNIYESLEQNSSNKV